MTRKPGGTKPKHRRRTRGRLRLFVAADPPPEVREEAAVWGRAAARAAAGLRPVPAENCHITLAFLGDREESELEPIGAALRAAATEVPVPGGPGVSLGAPVWLPPRRPRALALEIHDDDGELAVLQRTLAANLHQAVGWQSSRGFRAHLTCARTGRGFDPDLLDLPVGPGLEFVVESVTLYSSTLLPEGARYEPLERVELA